MELGCAGGGSDMVDAQPGGVRWRWKFSPMLPGKKKGYLEMMVGASSLRTFEGGAYQSQDLLQILPQPEDFPRGHVPITGFTAVLLSVHANHRTYCNSPAST